MSMLTPPPSPEIVTPTVSHLLRTTQARQKKNLFVTNSKVIHVRMRVSKGNPRPSRAANPTLHWVKLQPQPTSESAPRSEITTDPKRGCDVINVYLEKSGDNGERGGGRGRGHAVHILQCMYAMYMFALCSCLFEELSIPDPLFVSVSCSDLQMESGCLLLKQRPLMWNYLKLKGWTEGSWAETDPDIRLIHASVFISSPSDSAPARPPWDTRDESASLIILIIR